MSGVTVICPNNRRVVVKFNEGVKTLFQILDEACKKQGFMPEKYGLKHHARFVDLSLTFRMSGLPQNCTLEMAELPPALQKQGKEESEEVQVALQLSDGRRWMGNIPSDATLLDMLLDFEKNNDVKLIEPESDEPNMQPVCYYLQNEYVGLLSLAVTTLKLLGIRGRALFRYAARRVDPAKLREINEGVEKSQAKQRKLEASYEKKLQDNIEYEREQQRRRQEEEALEQLRQQEIDLQSQSVSSEAPETGTMETRVESPSTSISAAEGGGQAVSNVSNRQARLDALQSMLSMVNQSIVDGSDLPWQPETRRQPAPPNDFRDFKFPEETKGMDLAQRSIEGGQSSSGPLSVQPCDRRAIAFALGDVEEVVMEEPPPEFFDVTVDDVRSQLSDIKELSDERALLPATYVKQKDFERKLQAWKVTVIRFRMPDRTVLQGVFRALEAVTALYSFVEENSRMGAAQFELYLPPNIAVKKDDRSLLQAALVPRATLLCKMKAGSVHFADSCLPSHLIKSPLDADRAAVESLAENGVYMPFRPPPVSEGGTHRREGQTAYGHSSTSDRSTVPKWLQSKGKK